MQTKSNQEHVQGYNQTNCTYGTNSGTHVHVRIIQETISNNQRTSYIQGAVHRINE